MSKTIPLEHGKYYHIYNRGNNSETIFGLDSEFRHFIGLYEKYITSVADTYAWALMSNHYHFFIRIKTEGEIGYLPPFSKEIENGKDKWKTVSYKDAKRSGLSMDKFKKPDPSRQFSHLFNAYARHYNISHERTGSLFEKNFERITVESNKYKKQMVYYVHHNPIHHKIVENYTDYKWTSYNDFVNDNKSFVAREEVMDWFNDIDNFIFFHEQEHERFLDRGDEED